MVLVIRRGLIEETRAATIGDYLHIDMAVTAFANAMRFQSIVGNADLRAKWRKEYGRGSEVIQGLGG